MGGGPHLPTHSESTNDSDPDPELSTLHAWVRNTILSISRHVARLSKRKWDAVALQPGDGDEHVVVRDLKEFVRGVQYAQWIVREETVVEMQYSEPNQRGNIVIFFNRKPAPNQPPTVGVTLHILRLNPWSPPFLSQLKRLAANCNIAFSYCPVSSSPRERLPSDGPIAEDFLKGGEGLADAGKDDGQVGRNDEISLRIEYPAELKEVEKVRKSDVSNGWACKHCEEKVRTVEMLELAKRDLKAELRVKNRRLEVVEKRLRGMEKEQPAWEECGESEEKHVASEAEYAQVVGTEHLQPREATYEQTMSAEWEAWEKKLRGTNGNLKERVEKLKENSPVLEARMQEGQAKEENMRMSGINTVVGMKKFKTSEALSHTKETMKSEEGDSQCKQQ